MLRSAVANAQQKDGASGDAEERHCGLNARIEESGLSRRCCGWQSVEAAHDQIASAKPEPASSEILTIT